MQLFSLFESSSRRTPLNWPFPRENSPEIAELPHILACYFQIHRAFLRDPFIRRVLAIDGELRSASESIFTHDMERYKRSLYRRMQEIPTLITGPSGTGKELVAEQLDSRYILFDDMNEIRIVHLTMVSIQST